MAASRPKAAPPPPHLTMLSERAEQIPLLLRQLVDRKEAGQGTPLLIVEGLAIERPELESLTENLAPKVHAHAGFDLMIPELQQTYSGMRLGDRIHWIQQQAIQLRWQTLYYQAAFPRVEVQSVGELYQQIHAMGRKESRSPESETVIQLPGTVLLENVADFSLHALNRYRVTGRRVRLELDGDVTHEFTGEQGRWRLAEPSAAEAKPPSRPPLTGSADQYHTARWRAELNTFLQEPKNIIGRHHEFYLLSGVPMEANDAQAIRQRLQLGGGSLELLRLHDEAAGTVWTFQRQGQEWVVEERAQDRRIRWRPHGNHPQGSIEASDLMDLLRQLPSTTEGTEPLHIVMRGPWSNQYAAAFQEVLNQSGRPTLRPALELHYEGAQAEPRRQVYQRN
ncbi:MAG TPA: hypothetical protein VFW62_01080, partial [bacterium]|nr:hypothetical protein [bacterium]